jgi:hypothetical protein
MNCRLVFAIVPLLAAATLVQAAGLPRNTRPADARVYFISPSKGQVVHGKVLVRFGLSGMGVSPAGVTGPGTEGTGHHHLFVDAAAPAPDQVLPKDAQHLHFGKGQTETTLELPPGKHTLQLVFGDANHVPQDPPLVSERIEITVK